MAKKTTTSGYVEEIKKISAYLQKIEAQIENRKDNISPIVTKRRRFIKRLSLILQSSGFLIIFFSWVFQNKDEAKWQEKLNKQNYVRGLTGHLETISSVYNLGVSLFNSYKVVTKDTNQVIKQNMLEYLYKFYYNFIQLKLQAEFLISMDEKKFSPDWLRQRKSEFITDSTSIQKLFDEKDLHSLIVGDTVYGEKRLQLNSEISNINSYMNELEAEIASANRMYFIFYVIGSIFLALSYIINQIKSFWKSQYFE